MQGYIKDYRKELKSDIWLMPPMYHRVWQFLKYNVNHESKKIPMKDGTFFNVQKGQRLTSVRQIAQGVGYYEGLTWKEPNPKTISKIIEWLEKQQMIKIERGKGNRQYTLITLLNWDLHQVKEGEGNSKETLHGEGGKQSVDINKNDKELIKNDKETYTQIENLRQRYSSEQLKAIDNYFDMLKHTRASAKISENVVLKIYQNMDKYPPICVEYGVRTHTDNVAYHSKKENYTLGIIRNTTADEAFSKLNRKAPSQKEEYKNDSVKAPEDIFRM